MISALRLASLSVGLAVGLLGSSCFAQNVELLPFEAKDEWTFIQERTEPGKPLQSLEVRFSTMLKNKDGEFVLGVLKAITQDGQLIWQPIGKLPGRSCLRDFLSETDLGLTDACTAGVGIGDKWQSIEPSNGGTERLKFEAVGREPITVRGRAYDVIKIVGKGEKTTPQRESEDMIVTYWFAPDAKAMVRAERAYYSKKGKLLIKFVDEMSVAKLN